ncbi:MAG: arylsulfatase [Lentisphaeraceae bacterium]|nr:arylsulfatase [Lentisphaeraceae bacterium]
MCKCFFYVCVLLFSLHVQAAQKPNIIYILADDLGYADVGFNGQKYIRTPNIDQMRKEGMSFTQHYSGSTVCAPSRSCLMTGQHTGRTRVRGNGPGHLLEEDITVAQVLKKAGYKTACIGKWGLGTYNDAGAPDKKGFDHFFGYIDQSRAHHYYQDYLWRDGEKELYPENRKKRNKYSHDLFTEDAMNFIETNKNIPFFLYLAYTIPHVDLDVPEESIKPYLHLPEKGPYKGGHYISCEKPRATFAGMVSRLDDHVGKILKQLKTLGIEQNTMVIFTSDNGPTPAGGADPGFFNGNGDFRGIKRDLYEGGVRVPFVVRWPGTVAENSTSEHISAFWDFMATCSELAEVEVPSQSTGVSYLPTLLGKKSEQKKPPYQYWEFYEQGGKQAIRKGKWKGVRLNLIKNINAPMELYDLESDPGEQNNIAAKYPEVVQALLKDMASARTESSLYSFTKKVKKKKK